MDDHYYHNETALVDSSPWTAISKFWPVKKMEQTTFKVIRNLGGFSSWISSTCFYCFRQTSNNLTGEHSCVMVKVLNNDIEAGGDSEDWLTLYWCDFKRRFLSLLNLSFSSFPPAFALSILTNKSVKSTQSKGKYTYSSPSLYLGSSNCYPLYH